MADRTDIQTDSDERFWELALAINAAFKGLLGSQNQSGHICARARPISIELDVDKGWEAVCRQMTDILQGQLRHGDVVVIPDKVVAASEGRLGPRSIILDPDPKTIPPEELPALAAKYSQNLGFSVTPLHLLLADEYPQARATLGALDHNRAAADAAARIRSSVHQTVDVIISDTDTGLDTRFPLIGCITIGATPMGATAGLTLYEAMRCAVAAEFVRGHDRRIPIVICEPADRRRNRKGLGQMRHYEGALHREKEAGITYV